MSNIVLWCCVLPVAELVIICKLDVETYCVKWCLLVQLLGQKKKKKRLAGHADGVCITCACWHSSHRLWCICCFAVSPELRGVFVCVVFVCLFVLVFVCERERVLQTTRSRLSCVFAVKDLSWYFQAITSGWSPEEIGIADPVASETLMPGSSHWHPPPPTLV